MPQEQILPVAQRTCWVCGTRGGKIRVLRVADERDSTLIYLCNKTWAAARARVNSYKATGTWSGLREGLPGTLADSSEWRRCAED